MKSVRFLGNSLKALRDFPEDARQDAGYQIDKVQRGEQPDDFKPMPGIGKDVEEIRIWDESGTQEPVGLGNRRLQIDRSGPFFTVLFTHSGAMGLQIRQKLSSLGPIFAIDAPSPTGSGALCTPPGLQMP